MQDGEHAAGIRPAQMFAGVATAVISDNLERLPGAIGLRPFHRGGPMVGPASPSEPRRATIGRFTRPSTRSGLGMSW